MLIGFGILSEGIRNLLNKGTYNLLSPENTNNVLFTQELFTTPIDEFSGSAFQTAMQIAENLILPVAGVILTYIVVSELYTMVVAHNQMHDQQSWHVFRWLFKTVIAVFLLSNAFTISTAILKAGAELAQSAFSVSQEINIEQAAAELGDALNDNELGEATLLFLAALLSKLFGFIIEIIIFVLLIARMLEMYLMLAMSPIPYATIVHSEQKVVGINYIKNLLGLALQGIILVVVFSLYAGLQASQIGSLVAGEQRIIPSVLMTGVGYPLLLLLVVIRSRSVAQMVTGG